MIAAPQFPKLSLRISVTDRCQLRCQYCMPPEGIQPCDRQDLLSYEEIKTLTACLRNEFSLTKVRITGGEPLVRPQIERLIAMLADLGIEDIALTTNALCLAEKAAVLKNAGLRRVNISLDSLVPEAFRRLTGGGELRAVFDGIAAALEQGMTPVKLNTVVIRGVNDGEVGRLLKFAIARGCELRFIELMPIGPGAQLFPDGFMSSEGVRAELLSKFEISPIDSEVGTSARRYAVVSREDGRCGTVGFISSCSAPFCSECFRLRVTADGRLIGCLAADGGVSVREMLRTGNTQAVCTAARDVMDCKREDRMFRQKMAMASIGG